VTPSLYPVVSLATASVLFPQGVDHPPRHRLQCITLFHLLSIRHPSTSEATMLRRGPTSISLSNRDVTEHLEHIELQKCHERDKLQSRQSQRLPSGQVTCTPTVSAGDCPQNNERNEVTVYEFGDVNQQRMLRANATFAPTPPPGPPGGAEGNSHGEGSLSDFDAAVLATEDQLPLDQCSDSENEENLAPADPVDTSGRFEEPPFIIHEDASRQFSTRHTFDYGGFVESATNASSSFSELGPYSCIKFSTPTYPPYFLIVIGINLSIVPQDMSTPRNNEISEVPRLRRVPLPRSPLFRSQGANSPERRLTTSLTPRVASYGTPSLLLSQPPRRPRSYRHRTISYSFEESERASVAYEQVQGSDNESVGSQPALDSQRSIEAELDEGSSRSASLRSNMPSSPPELAEASLPRTGRAMPANEEKQTFHFSSPQLPLPPPFSAVPRNISSAASLPSTPREQTQARIPSSNSLEYDLPRLRASPTTGSTISSRGEEERSLDVSYAQDNVKKEADVGQSSSILRSLAALPFRLISAYRSRSPFQSRFDAPGSGRVSPTLRGSQGRSPEDPPPTSDRRPFQIYDDSMPASIQPQTPQNLPEARHQSRFHPSYTAPTRQRIESPGPGRSTTGRRRRTRSDSPTGMDTPGFEGLYGGQENTDDEVIFNRAAQRLWALGSAGRHGRSMSITPDRDISVSDNRGEYR
jgi:hypothetical protein